MTYSRVDDDEHDEDAAIRAASLNDPNRSGDPGAYKPPIVVGFAKCRNFGRCANVVAWNEEADDQLAVWNRQLAKQNEPLIERDKVMFCAQCEAAKRAYAIEHYAKARELMRDCIRELKSTTNPERERELAKKIGMLGHPDVNGLLESIRTDKSTNPRKRMSSSEVVR